MAAAQALAEGIQCAAPYVSKQENEPKSRSAYAFEAWNLLSERSGLEQNPPCSHCQPNLQLSCVQRLRSLCAGKSPFVVFYCLGGTRARPVTALMTCGVLTLPTSLVIKQLGTSCSSEAACQHPEAIMGLLLLGPAFLFLVAGTIKVWHPVSG